jgi:MFS transporter, YNFM family, putative membrane transport protein
MAHTRAALAGFLLGAAGMFAVMYSTQAILPELGRDFGVSAAVAGLTVSVVVVALAAGAWLWGPLSDRWGRKRTLVLASALVAVPTLAAGLAPSFGVLLACRALQGVCMPGLLTVGAPYVVEVFGPALGGRAMGFYIAALVSGGIVGRVGVALLTAAVGWRWPIGALALLPAAGALVMARTLPEAPGLPVTVRRRQAVRRLLRNRGLLQATTAASALFFTFVGVFSFVTFRLEGPPFGWSPAAGSLVFLLWCMGGLGPAAGTAADRAGWRAVVLGALGCAVAAVALTLPASALTLVPALALLAAAMFCGVTAAQLGSATSTAADRGVASAIYFSAYYGSGALGGYLPGLAWEHWRWAGLALGCLAVLAAALAVVVPARGRPA